MKEKILDYLLSDPHLTRKEVLDIVDFYMKDVSLEKIREIRSDVEHAFSKY